MKSIITFTLLWIAATAYTQKYEVFYVIEGCDLQRSIDPSDMPFLEWTILVKDDKEVFMLGEDRVSDDKVIAMERLLSDCLTFFPYASLNKLNVTSKSIKFTLADGKTFSQINILGCIR